MSSITCGFIGLGLIGGSIARALKKFDDKITMWPTIPAGKRWRWL